MHLSRQLPAHTRNPSRVTYGVVSFACCLCTNQATELLRCLFVGFSPRRSGCSHRALHVVFVTETLSRETFSPRTWVFFHACQVSNRRYYIQFRLSFWVWIIFPLEATVPQRLILTQRREHKKLFWKKWNKFGNMMMLSRQAERSGLINVIFTNEHVVVVKRFATTGGSWDFFMARLVI